MKGRGCADSQKQHAHTAKEDATSLTVSTEAIFLTAVIDALEGCDVAIVDVPGAFMQADMDELVHVHFAGTMVDKLLEINHEMHGPYVVHEGEEKVLHVKLCKALHGTLCTAQLFWEKLLSELINDWGFTTNPCDSCIVNKTIDGKQFTICWHVDDLKLSHVDAKVMDLLISMMEEEFGQESPMNIS